jgi:hypothetical protein
MAWRRKCEGHTERNVFGGLPEPKKATIGRLSFLRSVPSQNNGITNDVA